MKGERGREEARERERGIVKLGREKQEGRMEEVENLLEKGMRREGGGSDTDRDGETFWLSGVN